MKDASDLSAAIQVWISSPSGRYQLASLLIALNSKFWIIVMRVAQDIAHLLGHLLQQQRRDFIVCRVGNRQLSRQRYPQRPNADTQMQLPAIPPAVPTTLRPPGLCVYRSMRNLSI